MPLPLLEFSVLPESLNQVNKHTKEGGGEGGSHAPRPGVLPKPSRWFQDAGSVRGLTPVGVCERYGQACGHTATSWLDLRFILCK